MAWRASSREAELFEVLQLSVLKECGLQVHADPKCLYTLSDPPAAPYPIFSMQHGHVQYLSRGAQAQGHDTPCATSFKQWPCLSCLFPKRCFLLCLACHSNLPPLMAVPRRLSRVCGCCCTSFGGHANR